jgi:hypothetical protein
VAAEATSASAAGSPPCVGACARGCWTGCTCVVPALPDAGERLS